MTYNFILTLPWSFESDIRKSAKKFGISKSEVLRRALALIHHAVDADEVELVKDHERTRVFVK